MKLQGLFALGAVFFVGVCAPAVKADSYSTVRTTTQESLPVSDVSGTYTTTRVESVPTPVTVIREQPVIISQPASPEVVVVKEHRHHHHLINLGL